MVNPLGIIRAISFLSLMAVHAQAALQLVALMPAEGQFLVALEGIRTQAGAEYAIDVINMKKNPAVVDVANRCKAVHVKGLIIMDTRAVIMAQELQKYDTAFLRIPKFALMTLMAASTAEGLSNVAGVTFEIPLFTLVTHFRIISQKDFSTVGIFYRHPFEAMIEESKKLLEKEHITLHAVCVDCKKNGKITLQTALDVMIKSFVEIIDKKKSEVLIAPTDNFILNTRSLDKFWIGTVKKMKIPVIAPLDILASEEFSVAVFTADPDLIQLGAQSANQIVEHFENGTPMGKIGFEPTISIKSTVNVKVASELGWKLKEEKLGRINTIIK